MASPGESVSSGWPQTLQIKPMQTTVCETTSQKAAKLIKQLPSLRQNLYRLFVEIKKDYDWSFHDRHCGNGEEAAWIDITVGCTFKFGEGIVTWSYQTGDNSSTGGACGHPEWFTTSLARRSNCKDVASDLVSEIEDRIHELASGCFPFGE